MRSVPRRWMLLPTVPALCLMLGCQGLSAGKSPTTTTTESSSGGDLSVSSPNPAFGSVQVNTSQSQSETLTNTGGTALNVTQAAMTGTGFSISGLPLPMALPAGQSASFKIVFAPKTAGSASGTLTVTSDATDPSLTIALSGTGTTSSTNAPGTLSPSSTNINFGNVAAGTGQSLPQTLANTGETTLTITQASVAGAGFSITGLALPMSLDPGQSTTFKAVFDPQTAGSSSGTLFLSSNASDPSLVINLSGTGTSTSLPGTLSANATSISFGTVSDNSSQTLPGTLINVGGSAVTVTQAQVTGTGFSVTGINLPVTLASGQSTTFNVVFSPKTSGDATGVLTITSDASNPSLTINLNGTGTAISGQLTVAPTTLNLGNVVVGTSGTLAGTLSASGANVTITSASSNNSRFSLTGLELPVTIPAGQEASFSVTFTPQATGSASGAITFTSNASPSTTTVSLTGTGAPPPTHTVDLSWVASTSQDISGYNIYRSVFSGSCGKYTRLNSALNASTSYSDSTVSDGVTYCYVTTAVDSSNVESAYSAAVEVAIPAS